MRDKYAVKLRSSNVNFLTLCKSRIPMVFLDEQRYILYMSTVSENLRKQFAGSKQQKLTRETLARSEGFSCFARANPRVCESSNDWENPKPNRALQLATIFGCSVADLSPQLGEELAANAKGINLQDQTAYKTVGLVTGDVVDFLRQLRKARQLSSMSYALAFPSLTNHLCGHCNR